MRYHYDTVGMRLVGLFDRNIFAQYETFVREVNSDLVRHAGVVVEGPAAARAVNELAEGVVLIGS
jgi:hypothetical protein